MEQWKPVVGYEGYYEVSDRGRVRSTDRTVPSSSRNGGFRHRPSVILRQKERRNGYMSLSLSLNGVIKDVLVHRLVAKAFLPNPNGFDQVNHKNMNKADNRVENLEWCDQSMNMKHSILHHPEADFPFKRSRKRIRCVETGDCFISSYYAADWVNRTKYGNSKDACGMSRKIRGAATGRGKTAYGFHWEDIADESSTTSP